MNHQADQSTSVTRRTLVKGAAWSLPVVVAAVAAPIAAASTVAPDPVVDLVLYDLVYSTQGEDPGLPQFPTFNADNGLFVDARYTNNGPGVARGASINISLPENSHNFDLNDPHGPAIALGDGWVITSIPASGTGRRTIVLTNPTLELAPGETGFVRLNYWTTAVPGVSEQNIFPDASITPGDGQADANPGNDYRRTSNHYNIQT
ncbi:hypothetical protein [Leucobacter sp. wl10]|uniref:hypothetical protein n=1 Tax=Leucobacter sp. wl10 TaxID=2304677 RepID=UPI0013C375B8|nr:hypothetical protein [Leucobacter sp. wl10]